jgi:hypothetical protein
MTRQNAIDLAVKRVWDASNFLGRQVLSRLAESVGGTTIPVHRIGYAAHLHHDVAKEFHKILGGA